MPAAVDDVRVALDFGLGFGRTSLPASLPIRLHG